MYAEYSYREMAKVAKVSYRTVSRIVKELNLRRTTDEERMLRSKSRKALIRLERAHATFGFAANYPHQGSEQQTSLPSSRQIKVLWVHRPERR